MMIPGGIRSFKPPERTNQVRGTRNKHQVPNNKTGNIPLGTRFVTWIQDLGNSFKNLLNSAAEKWKAYTEEAQPSASSAPKSEQLKSELSLIQKILAEGGSNNEDNYTDYLPPDMIEEFKLNPNESSNAAKGRFAQAIITTIFRCLKDSPNKTKEGMEIAEKLNDRIDKIENELGSHNVHKLKNHIKFRLEKIPKRVTKQFISETGRPAIKKPHDKKGHQALLDSQTPPTPTQLKPKAKPTPTVNETPELAAARKIKDLEAKIEEIHSNELGKPASPERSDAVKRYNDFTKQLQEARTNLKELEDKTHE